MLQGGKRPTWKFYRPILSHGLWTRGAKRGSMRCAQRQTIHAAPRKKPTICAHWPDCSKQNGIRSTPSVKSRMRVEQIGSDGLDQAVRLSALRMVTLASLVFEITKDSRRRALGLVSH